MLHNAAPIHLKGEFCAIHSVLKLIVQFYYIVVVCLKNLLLIPNCITNQSITIKINQKKTAVCLLSLLGLFLTQFNVDASIVQLNSERTYRLLTKTTIANTGITADLGFNSAGALSGFSEMGAGQSYGNTNVNYDVTKLAMPDAQLSYDALAAFSYTLDLTGLELARTLNPGIYNFDVTAALKGDLTKDRERDYAFQIRTTLGTIATSRIVLTNGASKENIFFNINEATAIGAAKELFGTFIGQIAITSGAGINIAERFILLKGRIQ